MDLSALLSNLSPQVLDWIMRALAARLGLTNPALAESDEEIGASALPAGSSFANMPRQQAAMGRPVLQMHPIDAAARALGDGDSVLIQADDRQIEASLEIDPGIIAGVVALPGKWWTASGAATNTLTPSSWSPGGQPAYNETYVAVHASQSDPSG